jgi:hypothetical protein
LEQKLDPDLVLEMEQPSESLVLKMEQLLDQDLALRMEQDSVLRTEQG